MKNISKRDIQKINKIYLTRLSLTSHNISRLILILILPLNLFTFLPLDNDSSVLAGELICPSNSREDTQNDLENSLERSPILADQNHNFISHISSLNQQGEINSINWSSDVQYVVASSFGDPRFSKVIDVNTGQELIEVSLQDFDTFDFLVYDWHPVDEHITFFSVDVENNQAFGRLQLVTLPQAQVQEIVIEVESNESPDFIYWSPDGQYLAMQNLIRTNVNSWSSVLRVFELNAGELVEKAKYQIRNPRNIIQWTPDSRYLIIPDWISSRRAGANIFDAFANEQVSLPELERGERVRGSFLSSDGRYLFLKYLNTVDIFDLSTLTKVSEFPWRNWLSNKITWSPDRRKVALSHERESELRFESEDEYGSIREYDMHIRLSPHIGEEKFFTLLSLSSWPLWSPNSQYMIIEVEPRIFAVLDANTGEELLRISENQPIWLRELAWSPNSQYIAVPDKQNNRINLFDLSIKSKIQELEFDGNIPFRFDSFDSYWSPDGRYLTTKHGSQIFDVSMLEHRCML